MLASPPRSSQRLNSLTRSVPPPPLQEEGRPPFDHSRSNRRMCPWIRRRPESTAAAVSSRAFASRRRSSPRPTRTRQDRRPCRARALFREHLPVGYRALRLLLARTVRRLCSEPQRPTAQARTAAVAPRLRPVKSSSSRSVAVSHRRSTTTTTRSSINCDRTSLTSRRRSESKPRSRNPARPCTPPRKGSTTRAPKRKRNSK